MTHIELLGWCAASLMLAAFVCRDVKRLRALAILANVAFIAYGASSGMWPVCALHVVLLPINAWRLVLELRATDGSKGWQTLRSSVAIDHR